MNTGFAYSTMPDDGLFQDTAVTYIKKLPVEGIEIHLSRNRLINLRISKENQEFLDSLKYNTIHSPDGVLITDDELNLMERLYRKINAKYVVFHKPAISDFSRLESYNFKSLIENEDYRKDYNTSPEEIMVYLKKYDFLGFAFDFAHALSISKELVESFMNNLGDQINEVHISVIKQNKHGFVYNAGIDELLKNFFAKLPDNVPVINESVIDSLDKFNEFNKEIKYLRNFLDLR